MNLRVAKRLHYFQLLIGHCFHHVAKPAAEKDQKTASMAIEVKRK